MFCHIMWQHLHPLEDDWEKLRFSLNTGSVYEFNRLTVDTMSDRYKVFSMSG